MMIIISLLAVALGLVYWLFMSPYSQILGNFPYRKQTTKKVVALTFDDGPNEPYTSEIVDFLDENSIKATFFQVGRNIERYPETTQRMHKTGHVIGNHSLNHQFRKYLTEPNYVSQLESTQKIIHSVIGKKPALFRPPWLWRQPLLFRSLGSMGLKPVSGTFCDVLEVFQPSGSHIAKTTLRHVKPGSIIIFHDGFNAKGANRDQTVAAVKIVVKSLSDQGYSFVTVDKLLATPAYQ